MKIQRLLILIVAATLAIAGRAENANYENTAGATPAMLTRATQFRTSLKTDGRFRSGVYVYESHSVKDHSASPEKLAARLKLLGFTDVYLSCNSGAKNLSESGLVWRKKFIRTAHEYGMRVHAQTLERGKIFVDDQALRDDCAVVLNYNKTAAGNERFDGVSADLEPHIMKRNAADRPKELALVWDSEKNAGPGRDNDQLLKRTVEAMQLAKNEIGTLPLSQAVGFFFQTRYDDGSVHNGSAAQFLRPCDFLIVMAYNYKKTRVWEMAEPTIRAAGEKPASVSVCIKTSAGMKDGKADPTSLQTHGWAALIDTVDYIIAKGEKTPVFRGVDIFEYQGLEIMWTSGAE